MTTKTKKMYEEAEKQTVRYERWFPRKTLHQLLQVPSHRLDIYMKSKWPHNGSRQVWRYTFFSNEAVYWYGKELGRWSTPDEFNQFVSNAKYITHKSPAEAVKELRSPETKKLSKPREPKIISEFEQYYQSLKTKYDHTIEQINLLEPKAQKAMEESDNLTNKLDLLFNIRDHLDGDLIKLKSLLDKD